MHDLLNKRGNQPVRQKSKKSIKALGLALSKRQAQIYLLPSPREGIYEENLQAPDLYGRNHRLVETTVTVVITAAANRQKLPVPRLASRQAELLHGGTHAISTQL